MEPDVRVSGTWHKVWHIHAKAGGTWRDVETGWVKVSGFWRQFFQVFHAYQTRVDGAASPLDGTTGGVAYVPVNARHAKITLVGNGGPSWNNLPSYGGGGGGGCCVYDIDLSAADYGRSITYLLSNKVQGTPGAKSSSASCSFSGGTMSLAATGGQPYDPSFGVLGIGGGATGGNTSNTSGGNGSSSAGGASGAGDAGGAANTDGAYGGGAGPLTSSGTKYLGGAAYITIDWT